jgi:hypothetical protein
MKLFVVSVAVAFVVMLVVAPLVFVAAGGSTSTVQALAWATAASAGGCAHKLTHFLLARH